MCGVRAYGRRVQRDLARISADVAERKDEFVRGAGEVVDNAVSRAKTTYRNAVSDASEVIGRVSAHSARLQTLLELHTAKYLFASSAAYHSDPRVVHVGVGPCNPARSRTAPCLVIGVRSSADRVGLRLPETVHSLSDGKRVFIVMKPTETLGAAGFRSGTAAGESMLATGTDESGLQQAALATAASASATGDDEPLVPTELRVGGPVAYRVDRRGWGEGTIGTFVTDTASGDVYVVTNNHVVSDKECMNTAEDYCAGRNDCSWHANPGEDLGGACVNRAGGNEAFLGPATKVMSASSSAVEEIKGEVVVRLFNKKFDIALVKVPEALKSRVRCVTVRDADRVAGPHSYAEDNVFSDAERDAAWWKFWKRAFWSQTRKSWKSALGNLIESGMPIFKDGRRTSETDGHIRSYGDNKRSSMSRMMYGDSTTEDQFTIEATGNMCDHGDSGSSILAKSGNHVMGILWGGLDTMRLLRRAAPHPRRRARKVQAGARVLPRRVNKLKRKKEKEKNATPKNERKKKKKKNHVCV